MRDQNNGPFKIETLPMSPALIHENTRMLASYANFYIANNAVLIPTFNTPQDEIAKAKLAKLFPNRQIVSVPSTDLVWA